MIEALALKKPNIVYRLLPFITLKLAIKLALFALFCATAIMLIVYVYQMNTDISWQSGIAEAQSQVSKLEKENAELEMELAKFNSLEHNVPLISQLNFVKSDNIFYVKVVNGGIVAAGPMKAD